MTPLGEYGLAAQRKLRIACFHLQALRDLLPAEPDCDGLPPIPIQAHFEAGGWATLAIVDQLSAGIGSKCLDTDQIRPEDLLKRLPESDLRHWLADTLDDPRYVDLKSWRNRSVHRFDEKAYHQGQWVVLEPWDGQAAYGGSREIQSYLEQMLKFGEEVTHRLPEITTWVDELLLATQDDEQ